MKETNVRWHILQVTQKDAGHHGDLVVVSGGHPPFFAPFSVIRPTQISHFQKKRKLCYEGGNDIVKHFFTFFIVFANTDVLTAFLNAKCQFY